MSKQDEEILKQAKSWRVPENRSKEEVWHTIEAQIQQEETTARKSLNRKPMVAAAIVLVTLGLAYQLFWQTTAIETDLAETKSLTLPDGTEVTLNADSYMSYKASSFRKKRELTFEGEGFFEVKPGDSFQINLNGMQVSVLGTSFNIYARGAINEVKCLTGKVQVADGDKSMILGPGQAISSNESGIENKPSDFSPEEAISWREGKFLFTNAPMSRVVHELEIQYGVTVVAEELGNRFYTGYFDNKNLEKAVRQVFSPMGYTYEIENNKILVK